MEFLSLVLYILIIFIRPQEWITPIKNFPLVDVTAVITILITLMALRVQKLKIPRVPENFLMIGFFFAALMSHVAHTYLGGVISAFQEVGKIVIFYFLVVIIINSKKRIEALGWILVLSAAFMAVGGILQYYRGFGFGGVVPLAQYEMIRVVGYGIFGDPNDLGLFFAMVFPFALAFVFEKRGFFSMALAGICGATIIWATWLTNSRGSTLALFMAIVVFFRRRIKGFKWILATFAAVIIMATFLPSRLSAGLFDTSTENRIYFWGIGNRLLKENPIFGVGHRMFMEHADWRAAHSSIINCYAELGLFGYFFWVGLLYIVIIGLWKLKLHCKDRDNEYKVESLLLNDALLAGLIGYLIAGLFLTRTYILPLYLFIALGAKMRYLATDGKYLVGDLLPVYYTRRIFLISIGSVLFLYVAIRVLLARY